MKPPSLYGHAIRRAIATRRLDRHQWQGLVRGLRSALRSGEQGTRIRAEQLARELGVHTRCAIALDRSLCQLGDVLATRMYLTGAWCDQGEGRAGRSPVDCLGIPGSLRSRICTQWYPLDGRQTDRAVIRMGAKS